MIPVHPVAKIRLDSVVRTNARQIFLNVPVRKQPKQHQLIPSFKNSLDYKKYKTCVINDPLGQTHSLASSEHCFSLKYFFVWKSGDGQWDVLTDGMCKNNDHYRP